MVLTITSCILSVVIVLIDLKYNKVEEEAQEILNLLPGYNCGMCGYGSCQGMTDAMMFEPLEYKKCRPMKKEQIEEMLAYLRKKRKLID
jgi:Na+-translocating ferredoxin:NAD+ oxidoreductase subunit B